MSGDGGSSSGSGRHSAELRAGKWVPGRDCRLTGRLAPRLARAFTVCVCVPPLSPPPLCRALFPHRSLSRGRTLPASRAGKDRRRGRAWEYGYFPRAAPDPLSPFLLLLQVLIREVAEKEVSGAAPSLAFLPLPARFAGVPAAAAASPPPPLAGGRAASPGAVFWAGGRGKEGGVSFSDRRYFSPSPAAAQAYGLDWKGASQEL